MKPMILAVDDDRNFRDGLRRLLRSNGLSVITAGDGLEALEILKTEKVDIILADLQMPRMNGLQLLTTLKADENLRHIPVIMISGRDELDGVIDCVKHGADDYIHKPFDQTLLMTRVRSSLDRKLGQERERQQLRDITEQKQHVDELLHALFPQPIVEELKANKVLKPQGYERASVLFVDVVNFTKYCSTRAPEDIHMHLQNLIEAFEETAMRHNMQKIKTIGDAFMCVGGLWETEGDCAHNATKCALELTQLAPTLSAGWQVRAGLHVGPLIAGIVGHHRYQFDVWGDTVNVAARIQACCEAGDVMASDDVLRTLPDHYKYESQGLTALKGLDSINLSIVRTRGDRQASQLSALKG